MIKLSIFDFDAVFTNGQIHFDSIWNTTKFYNVKDGYGIKLLKENNIEVGIISGFKENDSQRKILEPVCLHKNAGICIMSTISPTGLACQLSCISVIIGIFNSFLIFFNIFKPLSNPNPL